jgi:NAD+ diphosphatase
MDNDAKPYVFADNQLDRVGNLRRDPAWVAERLQRADSRFLAFWQLKVLVTTGDQPSVAWLRSDVLPHSDQQTGAPLLGIDGDIAHFAVDLSPLEDPQTVLDLNSGRDSGVEFADVRAVAARLPSHEAGIVAQGRASIDWHARHKFCPACGAPSETQDSGLMRRCTQCAVEHFPRTDPVVIMLVEHQGRVLLGRQKRWPTGMYSCLAGFVDHGETIEAAVRREVAEETGVDVDKTRTIFASACSTPRRTTISRYPNRWPSPIN